MLKNNVDFSLQAFCKMAMHGMKYPHATCTGFLLSPNDNVSNEDEETDLKIIEAIPVTHTSHYLAPNLEIAFNAVKAFSEDNDMTITGYYHIDKQQIDQSNSPDLFAQRIGEKICELYSNPLLFMPLFENFSLETYQFSEGKWRKRPASSVKVEENAEQIIFNDEKLYRQIIDFEDHLDNISLDWTNQIIGQKIDGLSSEVC